MSAPALTLPWRKAKAVKEAIELPPPLVKMTKHPLIWLRQNLTLILLGILLVHVGTLIVVGAYYLLFGADGVLLGYSAPLNAWWHRVVPDDHTRHMLRNVYEGVLGGTLAQLVIFNRYKIKPKKMNKRNLLDRIEIALHIPNVKDNRDLSPLDIVLFLPLVVVYAAPGFWLGMKIAAGVKSLIFLPIWLSMGVQGGGLYDHILNLWTKGADEKLVGLFASVFMAKRIIRGFADNMQGYFAARRKVLGKDCRWYHPCNFKGRVNGLTMDTAGRRYDHATGLVATMLTGSILLGLLLAALGWYVLTYIAA